MQFVTVRDFRSASRVVWDKLRHDGELVVTNNGKPAAIMLNVGDDFEETLAVLRQTKAMRAFNRMRIEAENRGLLSGDEIEAEIKNARSEHKMKHRKIL